MPFYRIRFGETFRDGDGTIKTGGQTIELPDDMAALHRDKVEPIAEPAPALDAARDIQIDD